MLFQALFTLLSYRSQDFINHLPTEMLLHIFGSLSPQDLLSCFSVCCRWREVITGEKRLLRRVARYVREIRRLKFCKENTVNYAEYLKEVEEFPRGTKRKAKQPAENAKKKRAVLRM